MELKRRSYIKALKAVLAANPVGGILGPRQGGKTTLALASLKGLVVMDKIQRRPGGPRSISPSRT